METIFAIIVFSIIGFYVLIYILGLISLISEKIHDSKPVAVKPVTVEPVTSEDIARQYMQEATRKALLHISTLPDDIQQQIINNTQVTGNMLSSYLVVCQANKIEPIALH